MTPTQQDIVKPYDDSRLLAIPGDKEKTIAFCIAHFIAIAAESIQRHGMFSVALSGGSTPKSIFQGLTSNENRHKVDWKKCWIFWSDERAVPPTESESNYHMAMEAGLKSVGIPPEQVFRMVAEANIEENAHIYESLIKKHIPNAQFDLIMLGMGDDGHTASLFPWTDALHVEDRLTAANYIPEKKVWRMTFTYPCINAAKNIAIYVMGEGKAAIVSKVLKGPYNPEDLPIQNVGTAKHPALWIADEAAAKGM